ncbi:MAG: hypothetical protein EXS63_09525 [Candidatus Omnitrophica bacterium]|nr:hypothetical protein [Candidatus Omnitrophota bacterium]
MRVIVPIQGVVFFRNFISSGALSNIAKESEVIVVAMDPDIQRFELPAGMTFHSGVSPNPQRAQIRFWIQEFVMCGLRHRSKTFQLKLYRLSWKKKYIYPFLAFPLSARWVQKISEFFLGTDLLVDKLVQELKPDWIILPSSCEDSLTADFVKAAKKFGAKSFILVNGWDNLTSKGTLPVFPDKIGVWGPQGANDAFKIHRISRKRIEILGAPQFERYFQSEFSENGQEEVRTMNGIPQDKKVILFAGSFQPFDEITVLRILDKAIESGHLPNAHVLYRPHPWRHWRDHEDNFVSTEYKHVSLDVQVAEIFLQIKKSGKASEAKKVFPDLEYYPKIIQMAECILSPLSTFVLESLLMGKKTLAICYPDGKHFFSADKVSQYEHVQYMETSPGLKFCRDAKDLISMTQELLLPVDADKLHRDINNHLKFVVHSDNIPYAGRLAKVVSNA